MIHNSRNSHKKKIALEAYTKLKEDLYKSDDSGQKNIEHLMALEHMYYMENKLKEQEEKIEEYRTFFSLLSNLLPKKFPTVYGGEQI